MPTHRPAAALLRAVLCVVGLAVLVAGCGGGSSPAPTSTTATAVTSTPTPTPTSTAQVPLLFSPASVSFVSSSVGYALGVSACVTGGTTLCTGLARTTDGGVHWQPATAPPFLSLGDPYHQPVLRFADARTGFATDGRPGTGLLVTHDRGDSWTRLTGIPATAAVTSVETDGGHLLVVAGDDAARHLYVGTTGGTALTPVGPALAGTDAIVDAAVSGERAYVVSSPGVRTDPVSAWSSTGYDTWTPLRVPCPAGGTARVAAAGDRVVLVCQSQPQGVHASKRIWVSTDAGAQWSAAGGLNPDGYATGVALGSAKVLAVSTSSDADQLQASSDGGTTFTVSYASAVSGEGQGLFDLDYVDAQHAYAVLGTSGAYAVSLASGARNQPGPRLLASVDGGHTWTQIQVKS